MDETTTLLTAPKRTMSLKDPSPSPPNIHFQNCRRFCFLCILVLIPRWLRCRCDRLWEAASAKQQRCSPLLLESPLNSPTPPVAFCHLNQTFPFNLDLPSPFLRIRFSTSLSSLPSSCISCFQTNPAEEPNSMTDEQATSNQKEGYAHFLIVFLIFPQKG